LELKDIVPADQVALTLERSGFNPVSLPAKFDGKDIELSLSEQGSVYYTSERSGSSLLYSANIDGSNEKQLSDSGSNATQPFASGTTVYYQSDKDKKHVYSNTNVVPQGYQYNVTNGQNNPAFSLSGNLSTADQDIKELVDYRALRILTVTNTPLTSSANEKKSQVRLNSFAGGNGRVVFEVLGSEQNKYLIKPAKINSSGNLVAFVVNKYDNQTNILAESKLMVVPSDGVNPRTIQIVTSKNNELEVLAITADNQYLIAADLVDGKKVIKIFNLLSNQQNTYPDVSLFRPSARLSFDNKYLYFISSRDARSDVYRMDIASGNFEQMTDNGKVARFDLTVDGFLFYQSGSTLSVLKTDRKDKSKEAMISTNFQMWGEAAPVN
jgi:hypothetical protein